MLIKIAGLGGNCFVDSLMHCYQYAEAPTFISCMYYSSPFKGNFSI